MALASKNAILFIAVAILGISLPAAAASTAAQGAHAMRQAPAITVFSGALRGVSATSSTDVWAVGDQCPQCNDPRTLTLHWNGTHWSMMPSPNPGPNPGVGFYLLNGASARSPGDAWAVGGSCATTCGIQKTVILQWKGTAWSKVASASPGPAINGLSAVAALSPADAWAVGDYCIRSACGARNTLILRWNGTAWARVPSPSPSSRGTGNALSGVGAVSAHDAWAVGTYVDATTGHNDTLMLHWNGTGWSRT